MMTLHTNSCFSSPTHPVTHLPSQPSDVPRRVLEQPRLSEAIDSYCTTYAALLSSNLTFNSNTEGDWMPSQLERLLTKDDYYFPVGVFLEGVFWGVYTALFIAALWVWGKRRSHDGTPTSTFARWLYLVLITLMWLIACAHLGISIQRLLRIHVLEIEVGRKPHSRIIDATRWDNMAHILLTSAMVLLGDILVIYRTYIVWNRSLRVVMLPMLIHMAYVVANIICTYGLSHPDRMPPKITAAWSQVLFSLVFAQNVITTALLTYKTYSTHRMSRKNGATNATCGAMGLGSLSWMLIETAMLYTMELLVMIVLVTIMHPATAIASVLLVPTLGIVFVLLSVRVYFSGTPTTMQNWSTESKVPSVLGNSDLVLDDGAAVTPLASTGAQRPVTPLSLDGGVDMDVLTLRRHDLYDLDREEDRHPESSPDWILQTGSLEWL